ncbi:MAG: tetratricopeptide repeat protein [Rhodanobacteraceae bacterium]|jgi:Flp pilus assembly protein TadD|nr:tetratricopeptide repeat protein [Rhodanobacteraceae bacterium]
MPDPAPILQRIVEALRGQRPDEAERLARALLAQRPGDEPALALLAYSLHVQGKIEQAVGASRELTERFPHAREYWSNLATMLRECGRLDEAESAYRHALQLAPPDATLCLNLGLLLMQKGDPGASRDYLLHAHRLDPASIEIRLYAALASIECGDNHVAHRLLDDWQDWNDIAPEWWLDLGRTLGLLGHVEAAEDLLRRAATRPHERMLADARRVMLYERANRLDEARALLATLPLPERVDDADLRGEVVGAHAALLARAGDAEAAAQLERLLAATPLPAMRANLLFLLARVRDRQRDAAGAMQALQEAHALQAAAMAKLEPALAAGTVEPLMRAARDLDPARFAAWPAHPAPDAADSPVFIVGFPRSGTTLLEQMLDAHPALCSMDERAFLQDLIDHMAAAWGLAYPDDLGELTAAQCDELRALYWQRVGRTVQRAPGTRLVDKNPLNLLRLPLIMRLFPHAPIVLALRHPCDVLLSCYQQNFRSPAFALVCASLDSLARGYVNAMRFWQRHAQLMQPRALALRYEDLLDDFAAQADRLAAFLGLDDAAPMRRFDEHARQKRFISTPSYAQVVQPLNRKAVGRWHAYAPWFGPVLPRLQPLIEAWGYAEPASAQPSGVAGECA